MEALHGRRGEGGAQSHRGRRPHGGDRQRTRLGLTPRPNDGSAVDESMSSPGSLLDVLTPQRRPATTASRRACRIGSTAIPSVAWWSPSRSPRRCRPSTNLRRSTRSTATSCGPSPSGSLPTYASSGCATDAASLLARSTPPSRAERQCSRCSVRSMPTRSVRSTSWRCPTASAPPDELEPPAERSGPPEARFDVRDAGPSPTDDDGTYRSTRRVWFRSPRCDCPRIARSRT